LVSSESVDKEESLSEVPSDDSSESSEDGATSRPCPVDVARRNPTLFTYGDGLAWRWDDLDVRTARQNSGVGVDWRERDKSLDCLTVVTLGDEIVSRPAGVRTSSVSSVVGRWTPLPNSST
jgi:hypothetical protein